MVVVGLAVARAMANISRSRSCFGAVLVLSSLVIDISLKSYGDHSEKATAAVNVRVLGRAARNRGMGLWENSVDLALEKGDLELAQINTDMLGDDDQLARIAHTTHAYMRKNGKHVLLSVPMLDKLAETAVCSS